MNLLLFFLTILALQVLADDTSPPEMGRMLSDEELSRKFGAVLTERRVEGFLGSNADLSSCRVENKFSPTDSETVRNEKLTKAKKCFEDKIKNKSEEDLAKLAGELRLQNYGLIKSKNSRDITEYLTKKMHKALTGVDLDEKDPSVLKNRKMVDQKIFIDLYANRLQKNVLFEISRFCFENLRKRQWDQENEAWVLQPQGTKSFTEYWGPDLEVGALAQLTDEGEKGFDFGEATADDIYDKLLASVGNNVPANELQSFFEKCGNQIRGLCEVYELNNSEPRGKNACLTKARLQNARIAITDTKKIKDFYQNELADPGTGITLNVEKYDSSQRGANSMDNLTNLASNDFLKGQNKEAMDLAQECVTDPSKSKCKDFYAEGPNYESAVHQIEMESDFRWQTEKAKLEKLKDKDLETYLEEAGYLDLLDKFKKNELTKDAIVDSVRRSFEAKRTALITSLNDKLKPRQLREDEARDEEKVTVAVTAGAEAVRDEGARLAQTVLFNNIITSYLELKVKTGEDSYRSLGRNSNALAMEQQNLPAGVNSEFFDNLRVPGSSSSSGADGYNEINGLDLINQFLGKPAN